MGDADPVIQAWPFGAVTGTEPLPGVFFGRRIMARQIMSAASAGVIVGNRSYIFVGAIIGVRTSGM